MNFFGVNLLSRFPYEILFFWKNIKTSFMFLCISANLHQICTTIVFEQNAFF